MDPAAAQPPSPREYGSARTRLLLVLAAVGFVLVAALVLGAWLVDRYWDRRLEAVLDELRAAGEPVTIQEVFDRLPDIPDEENSALVLLDAFAVMVEPGSGPLVLLVPRFQRSDTPGYLHSPTAHGMMRKHLEANAEALALIHEAARLERGRYPVVLADGPFATELPHLSQLRSAARLCAAEAAWRAGEGLGDEAARSLTAGLRLSASLGDGAFLIEALVRMAVDAIAVDSAERCLELCELPPEALRALRAELAHEDAGVSLKNAMRGERSGGHYIFVGGIPDEMRHEFGGSWATAIHEAVPGWRQQDGIFWFEHLSRAVKLADLPLRERLRAADRLSQDLETAFADITARSHQWYGLSQLRYLLSAMLMPALSRASQEEVKAHVRLQVARPALAAEEWRLRHGDWPESLDTLVPELLDAVPEDPFSDGPVLYGRTEQGVIVYSVGPDGADQGGALWEELPENEQEGDAGDIRFRLLDPALRRAGTQTLREDAETLGLDIEYLIEQGLLEPEPDAPADPGGASDAP